MATIAPPIDDDAIVDPATYADPDTYDRLFARLREEDPVHWTAPADYRPFWSVTKFADIQEVERNAAQFLNAPRMMLRPLSVEEQVRKLTGGSALMLRDIVHMDGRDHMAHRKLTQAWFMPARLKALEEDLRALARHFVGQMIERGGSCDFVDDVAVWYPLRVIMRILGVPAEDEAKMLVLTRDIFGPDDPDVRKGPKPDLATTIKGFTDYFAALTEARRRDPSDDIATLLSTAEVDGQPIGTLELMSYYIIIATAGHDTTSSTIAGGLLALLENPGEMARLRADPSILAANGVDEMVRWVTPVKHFFRTAVEDYELRGKRIRAGDHLMLCYPSANRDEEAFADPFRFDLSRPPNRHLAFGYGPHLCLGQHLAKMEIRIFFEELLARVDAIELAGDPAWVASNFVSGLKRLPIAYKAR
ncbi:MULTISPECIES: cytochrome P450 [unclassified Sphingopyxis]|uniref:cytochrome P450 n=1 Tax=unclassified Sphingopyxis TaxID=2614943 RepID=UPI0007372D5F|nr:MULTISPECIES: cytochrome P450 [unclassified Sphingopyxis]KTE38587.1 cytochrome [Sphingopyxis sp. HIX]KTE83898.1 cytochrome [Sphingopyxis sp. HXXIV]